MEVLAMSMSLHQTKDNPKVIIITGRALSEIAF
jgi:hypothetical protein